MNDFERQIREAISTARNGAKHAEQSLTNPLWQAKSSVVSLGGIIPQGNRSSGDSPAEDQERTAAHAAQEGALSFNQPHEANTAQISRIPQGKRLYERPGILQGRWDNPYIAAAMPLLLLVENIRSWPTHIAAEVRPPIVRELQFFQQNLQQKNCPQEDVNYLSYLLCTSIDSIFNGLQTPESYNQSLLVEFHRDAWGGEDCFEHLRVYMDSPKQYREILEFYDLILSLGFEGKYQMLDHGSVLLMDLRSRLHTQLYGKNDTQSLAMAQAVPSAPRRQHIRARKIFIYGFALCLCAYSATAWYLHQQSQQIRSNILTWVLPEPRKINIMETLPNPLSNILNEGWLEVRKDPRGWLLIFTSDGAFRTGQAALSEEFINKQNIERLGKALAPWPGDMEVIGHTDNTPFRSSSGNNNLKLSAARAAVVADKLRESTQINETHQREINAIGRGENEPLADNATEEGRRRNRRVDILWKIGQRDADQAMQQYLGSPTADAQGIDTQQ
jgi:type VI secretion system protein ImpK